MKEKSLGMISIISLVIVLSISGCLSSTGGKAKDNELVLEWNEMELYAEASGLAQDQPYEYYSDWPLIVDHNNVTQIIVNITIEDGDEGTNPDHVDRLIFAPFVNDVNIVPYEINGGDTPFTGQLVYKAEEGEILGDNWYIGTGVTLHASDDQWPGPLIWRGIPDEGFDIYLEVRYEYVKEGDLTF